mgnify:CR=1 FL=1
MPRKGPAPKHPVVTDPVYGSPLVTSLINKVLVGGKRSVAERIVYGALEGVEAKVSGDPVVVLKRALENVRPALEVKSRRVGGATYQVPVEVRPVRSTTLALRWQRGGEGVGVRQGQAQTFSMEPGRASVAGVTVLWDRARYATSMTPGGQPQLDFAGRIESFSLAELARRLGDDNVSGDLQMQGQFKVNGMFGTPAFAAQVELARASGDLRAGDNDGALLLGLRELSLRLKADASLWQIAFVGEGQRLGRAELNASVRTADSGGLPSAASALSGNVQARMDDISVWNSLLPTGWRIGGGVNGSASLGGTLGEPTAPQGCEVADPGEPNSRIADAGTGTVRVNGQGPFDGKAPFLMNAVFEQFAVLTRVDRRVEVSGQTSLSIAAKQVLINGKLTVDRGLIDITQVGAPTLSDDVVVMRKSDALRPVATGAAPKVTMNLVLDLGKDLRLGRSL